MGASPGDAEIPEQPGQPNGLPPQAPPKAPPSPPAWQAWSARHHYHPHSAPRGLQAGEGSDWQGSLPWAAGLRHKRRGLLFVFFFLLGLFFVLFLLALGLVALAYLILQGTLPQSQALLGLLCLGPLVFFLLASLLGGWAFRRYASPVAEVMAAADAVAGGDLRARVRERYRGDMGRLARSFNRMAAGLEQAQTQRRNLTADVAHELRTPLHIIQGNLEGLLDGVYQPTPEHLAATLDETRLLSRLVEDLQTLSLAEAGQLPLHLESLSAADLLSDVVVSFSAAAATAGVELLSELAGDPDALMLTGDPDRLEQVLGNLVSNALRYTPPGGRISLRAAALPAALLGAATGLRIGERDLAGFTGPGVRLEVRDSGPGIPLADQPYIFDRFWKGDRARSRQPASGSGLGLAIARQLVQAHGGTIRVESRVGEGTRFVIELPGKNWNAKDTK
jgi:two-component system OmpR family sensor kinase/two-component system sensor histidine kinase BaeS